jgi:hypothetical protein
MKKRPITKRVITCIKQCSHIVTDEGEISYLGCCSGEIIDHLKISPRQLYQAVCSLKKQGKIVSMGCPGLYNLPLTDRQQEIREAFFDWCGETIEDVRTVNEIDSLLKLRSELKNI